MKQDVSGAKHFREAQAATPQDIRQQMVYTLHAGQDFGCVGHHSYICKVRKHQNGTFEGSCQHTDQYGHRCGHGPEKHGLKKW